MFLYTPPLTFVSILLSVLFHHYHVVLSFASILCSTFHLNPLYPLAPATFKCAYCVCKIDVIKNRFKQIFFKVWDDNKISVASFHLQGAKQVLPCLDKFILHDGVEFLTINICSVLPDKNKEKISFQSCRQMFTKTKKTEHAKKCNSQFFEICTVVTRGG